jgi:hypothetical protein
MYIGFIVNTTILQIRLDNNIASFNLIYNP